MSQVKITARLERGVWRAFGPGGCRGFEHGYSIRDAYKSAQRAVRRGRSDLRNYCPAELRDVRVKESGPDWMCWEIDFVFDDGTGFRTLGGKQ